MKIITTSSVLYRNRKEIDEILKEIMNDADSLDNKIFFRGQYPLDLLSLEAYQNTAISLIELGTVATYAGIEILRNISNTIIHEPLPSIGLEDSNTFQNTAILLIGWGTVATYAGIELLQTISNNIIIKPSLSIELEDSNTFLTSHSLITKKIDWKTGKVFITLNTMKNPNAIDETKGILLKYATKNNRLKDINPVEIVNKAWK